MRLSLCMYSMYSHIAECFNFLRSSWGVEGSLFAKIRRRNINLDSESMGFTFYKQKAPAWVTATIGNCLLKSID
jgi:hypothetical protein